MCRSMSFKKDPLIKFPPWYFIPSLVALLVEMQLILMHRWSKFLCFTGWQWLKSKRAKAGVETLRVICFNDSVSMGDMFHPCTRIFVAHSDPLGHKVTLSLTNHLPIIMKTIDVVHFKRFIQLAVWFWKVMQTLRLIFVIGTIYFFLLGSLYLMIHSWAFICAPFEFLSVLNWIRSTFSAIEGTASTFLLISYKVRKYSLAYITNYISFNFVSLSRSKDDFLLFPLKIHHICGWLRLSDC